MIVSQNTRLFLTHTLLLIIGGFAGLVVALLLSMVPWNFSADLDRARQLGIVSETILKGYPKRLDIVTFALAFVLPVCGALAFWTPWGLKRRDQLCSALFSAGYDSNYLQPHRSRPFLYVAAIMLFIAACFNINIYYNEYWTESVGAWGFLAEEGEFLEWTNRILKGDVQGKDFFCLYGPLMVYPLALLQKIAGPAVSLGRWYAFALNVCSYILLAFILNRLLKSSVVGLMALLLLAAIYPYHLYSANISPLRVVLGVAPLIFLMRASTGNSAYWFFLTGITAGASFLFSQEVGVCACIASTAYLGLKMFMGPNSGNVTVKQLSMFMIGFTFVMLPFITYFSLNGALKPFLENMFSYPHLVMLGYGGIAFPSLYHALQSPFAPVVFDNYWILSIYVVTASVLITRLILGKLDEKDLRWFYLLIFGLLLFRSALGRSGVEKAYFVAPPAFLLLTCYLDHGYELLKKRVILIGTIVSGSAILMMVLILLKMQYLDQFRKELVFPLDYHYNPIGTEVYGLERNDVRHPARTAQEIQLIADFFNTHQTGEYVYFFPNEPAYYFIFDKRNPTRYPMSYHAVTTEMRLEVIRDIERHKPEYVVYSKNTWRPDNLMVDIQVPEIFSYVKSKYSVVQDVSGVVFLRRYYQ